ncbi:TIGR00159 family protein [Heliorestis acidaminivorans]|uniref:Diadenylate cyclase n=1 Tax=Heliorestis acidaminivorans TaxID=553427 RepID=A0A6I0EVF9_9FIRM|nr:diadenylate cyclase CdaA [Heliorestis acidaminivorans]KAB2953474.1 TIGR00159 family protein [Heliorestis acidaminivorans]
MFPPAFEQFDILSIIDIMLVAYIIYRLTMFIKGTRAVQLLKGFGVLIIASYLSEALNLTTLSWILKQAWTALIVALPIVFQPELRRTLEQLGRGKLFRSSVPIMGEEDRSQLIGEIVRAVGILTKNKIGALIIFERQTGVNDVIETGTKIDGKVSAEFMVNIFIPNTPLHDGAVVIQGDRVAAAGCYLPLTDNTDLSKELGTRHRAGIGITEQSDAVSVIVSEETGTISIAVDGEINRFLDETSLSARLEELLQPKNNNIRPFWQWRGGR